MVGWLVACLLGCGVAGHSLGCLCLLCVGVAGCRGSGSEGCVSVAARCLLTTTHDQCETTNTDKEAYIACHVHFSIYVLRSCSVLSLVAIESTGVLFVSNPVQPLQPRPLLTVWPLIVGGWPWYQGLLPHLSVTIAYDGCHGSACSPSVVCDFTSTLLKLTNLRMLAGW